MLEEPSGSENEDARMQAAFEVVTCYSERLMQDLLSHLEELERFNIAGSRGSTCQEQPWRFLS